jgi:hypothetical protein
MNNNTNNNEVKTCSCGALYQEIEFFGMKDFFGRCASCNRAMEDAADEAFEEYFASVNK